MVGTLDLIASKSEKPVDFCQERIRIALEVLIEIGEVSFEEVKLVLCDSFEHVLVVVGKEKELSTAASLTLYQVKHLLGVVVQLKRLVNVAQVVALQQSLEYFGRVDSHTACQDTQPRQQAQIDDIVADNLGIYGNRHFLSVLYLFGRSRRAEFSLVGAFRTLGIVTQMVSEIVASQAVVLFVGDVYSRDNSDHLRYLEDVQLIVLFLDIQEKLLKINSVLLLPEK